MTLLAQLKRPPSNTLDRREERPIHSAGIVPCCGEMPLGVEFVPVAIGTLAIIKCSKCYNSVMTMTVAEAVKLWNEQRGRTDRRQVIVLVA